MSLLFQDMIEDGDTDEFNEAIKGFDIKSYEDLQVNLVFVVISWKTLK